MIRVLLLCLSLAACAGSNALPEDFDSSFAF
ncbi:DNA polymerase III subunit chi [Yoonia sp. R2331]